MEALRIARAVSSPGATAVQALLRNALLDGETPNWCARFSAVAPGDWSIGRTGHIV